MLIQAFDRSRWAEALNIRERIEADTRHKRAFVRQRTDRDRKEDIEEKAEAAASAVALAIATSPPATARQIAAFEADLTLYETSTVEALMENDRQMTAVQARLEALLHRAYVIEDGRRVFRTEDGTQVFDEFGAEVLADQLDPTLISADAPTWETAQPVFAMERQLIEERQTLLEYQQHLDEARGALNEDDITQAELEELQTQLTKTMPEAVRESLPNDHPAAQADPIAQTITPISQTSDGPSLEGLTGFAPGAPLPGG